MAATRALEGEPQARVSLVSLRGDANPQARASSEVHEPALRTRFSGAAYARSITARSSRQKCSRNGRIAEV
jgi:hypothetical protein